MATSRWDGGGFRESMSHKMNEMVSGEREKKSPLEYESCTRLMMSKH